MLITILYVHAFIIVGMKVIRHSGVDSRMIILDDQARQQITSLPTVTNIYAVIHTYGCANTICMCTYTTLNSQHRTTVSTIA